jgi:hypothetical protein
MLAQAAAAAPRPLPVPVFVRPCQAVLFFSHFVLRLIDELRDISGHQRDWISFPGKRRFNHTAYFFPFHSPLTPNSAQGVRFRDELNETITRYGGVCVAPLLSLHCPSCPLLSFSPPASLSHTLHSSLLLPHLSSYDSCFDPSKCTVLIAEEPSGDK